MPAMIQTHPAIKSRVRRFTLNSIIRYFSLCSACHSYVGGYSCDPCQTVCPYRNACLYPDPDVSCQICPYRAYSCDDRNRDGLPDGSDDRICRASTAHCHDVDGHCYDVVEDDHIYRDTICRRRNGQTIYCLYIPIGNANNDLLNDGTHWTDGSADNADYCTNLSSHGCVSVPHGRNAHTNETAKAKGYAVISGPVPYATYISSGQTDPNSDNACVLHARSSLRTDE